MMKKSFIIIPIRISSRADKNDFIPTVLTKESTIDSIIEPGTKIKLTLNTEKMNVFTADGSANILTGVCNDCATA